MYTKWLITMHVHDVRENYHWTPKPNPSASQKQHIVCPHSKCGKSFTSPIELNLQIKSERARYYGCPYCFWPVGPETVILEDIDAEWTENLVHNMKKRPTRSVSGVSKKSLDKRGNAIETIKPADCEHFIGYLETRPQNAPIPDECLTCDAVINCTVLKKKRK